MGTTGGAGGRAENNFLASAYEYVSRGYYDQVGFQTVPVNWSINTENKRQFFDMVRTITRS
jgi:hypothetical protein